MRHQGVAVGPDDSFGGLLRAWRRRAQMTQEELAERSGVSDRTVRNLETGRAQVPHRRTVMLLADALEITGAEREAFTLAGRRTVRPPDAQAAVAPSIVDIPAQLPANVTAFVGRTDEVWRLDALRLASHMRDGATDRTSGAAIALIVGTAGVGKTALAVHWARRVQAHFPDGQLYVNLHGYAASEPLAPVHALARFLRALGARADDVPTETEEAAAMYRTRLAGKRVLVMLDNAYSPEQVRPLLPGGAGCLVVVTSRNRLTGLVARDEASMVGLAVLSKADASELLDQVVGADRMAAEPAAREQLVDLCARLPLALRVAAASLTAHPSQTVKAYTQQLRRDNPLVALDGDGDPGTAVQAAFGLSYSTLPDPTRRLFRLLGLVPGPDFTAETVAALAEVPVDEARRALENLAAMHLVGEGPPGRYSFHDLLRRFAAERCAAEDGPAASQRAMLRLLHRYWLDVHTAATLLYPHVLRLPAVPQVDGAESGPVNRAEAAAWLDAERHNLVAAVGHAASRGPRTMAWLLADALRTYFWLGMHTADWRITADAALAAAAAEGDQAALAAASLSLGQLNWSRSRYEHAIDQFTRAMSAARRAHWLDAQATIGDNLGIMLRLAGRLPEAAVEHRRALRLSRRTGRAAAEAGNLCNLAVVSWERGDLRQARTQMSAALTRYRQNHSPTGEALALGNLGDIHRALGDFDCARECGAAALAMHREVGNRGNEADTLRCLAAIASDAGHSLVAAELAEAALVVASDTGHRRFEIDTLNTLVEILRQLGRHDDALACGGRALALARQANDRYPEAVALVALGTVYEALGEPDAAIAAANRALWIAQSAEYRVVEGEALNCIAGVHLHGRRFLAAVRLAELAMQCAQTTRHYDSQLRSRRILSTALEHLGRTAQAPGSTASVGRGHSGASRNDLFAPLDS